MAAVNRIGPARRFFMHEAGGAVGDLPRLLKGEALVCAETLPQPLPRAGEELLGRRQARETFETGGHAPACGRGSEKGWRRVMAYRSLREFMAKLEAAGELVRVSEPVSTVLEMTEIQRRLLADGRPGGAVRERRSAPTASRRPCPAWSTCSARSSAWPWA